jgi:hypothetical protein
MNPTRTTSPTQPELSSSSQLRIPPHSIPHSPIILQDSTAALVWSTPPEDEDDNRLACSLHAPLARSLSAPRVHTMLPTSYATLTVPNSTLQTSTASNDNSLYAPRPLAPNSSTQCPPPPHSTPQTNCLVRPHSSYPCATMIHPLQSPSHPTPSKQPFKCNPTSKLRYSGTSPTGYYRLSPTERPLPPLQRSGMKIGSTTWNNVSYTTKIPSTTHLPAMYSTMAKLQTSTSQSATGYTRRKSGSDSTTMALSQVTTQHRALTSNHTSSIYTLRQTSASIPPSRHCQVGLGTCSRDQGETSRFYSKPWLTQTIGAWPVRLHNTVNSTTTSRLSPSRLNNISATSTPLERSLEVVSHTSCSPAPPSRLPRYKTYLGRLERYIRGGRGVTACHAASMFIQRPWRTSRDVHGHPS